MVKKCCHKMCFFTPFTTCFLWRYSAVMKYSIRVLAAALLVLAAPITHANSTEPAGIQRPTQHPAITIHVNGLVCDFCAQVVIALFHEEEAVQQVNVDLTTQLIQVWLHENQTLSDEKLTELVTGAGYSVVNILRTVEEHHT